MDYSDFQTSCYNTIKKRMKEEEEEEEERDIENFKIIFL
jgi:hypothetical protein